MMPTIWLQACKNKAQSHIITTYQLWTFSNEKISNLNPAVLTSQSLSQLGKASVRGKDLTLGYYVVNIHNWFTSKSTFNSALKIAVRTVPLKSKLPPLLTFLTIRVLFPSRRFSFLASCLSFLSTITEAFSMGHIYCSIFCGSTLK